MACEEWRKIDELGRRNGLQRLASWVGGRARLELGRRAGFMVAGLVQISNGGKERNLEGRWRRKCEERDGWDVPCVPGAWNCISSSSSSSTPSTTKPYLLILFLLHFCVFCVVFFGRREA